MLLKIQTKESEETNVGEVKDREYYLNLREKEKFLHMDLDTNNDVNGRDLDFNGRDDFEEASMRDANHNGIEDAYEETMEGKIERIKRERGLEEPKENPFTMSLESSDRTRE